MNWEDFFWKKERYNYLFSINPGRSGSKYLSELLGTAPHVTAFHEAKPQMIDEHLLAVTEAPYEQSFKSRCVKLKAIKKACRQLPEHGHYIETNHMFIKTFFDVVSEKLPNVQVIHLQRDFSEVVKSFVEMNYFTQSNKHWQRWMIRPDAVTRSVELPKPYEEMDQFDRVIAYLLDIEGRAVRYKTLFPHISVHEIRLEELNDAGRVRKLFDALGLEFTSRTGDKCGRIVNRRDVIKEQHANPVSRELVSERIHAYIEDLENKGILFPHGIRF